MSATTVLERTRQLVVFTLGGEEYGVAISRVREIIRYTEPRRVPESHADVLGMIELRGSVLPVVCLRRRFGWDDQARPDDAKIVVLDRGDQPVGIVVDEVREVRSIDSEDVQDPPAAVGSARYVVGVARVDDRLVVVLDAELLIDEDSLPQ